MFLLVSVRHVGAHAGEHQHGVSIQISISLGKTFLRLSRIRNIPLIWILARVFVYAPPFISQILDFIYWTVLIFILIYFEWCETENQQILHSWCSFRGCNPFVEIWTCKSPAKNTHEPGPAWQRIAGNYRIRGERKSHPGVVWYTVAVFIVSSRNAPPSSIGDALPFC